MSVRAAQDRPDLGQECLGTTYAPALERRLLFAHCGNAPTIVARDRIRILRQRATGPGVACGGAIGPWA
jgi:hypothetical protein